jgi:hypothetical protein
MGEGFARREFQDGADASIACARGEGGRGCGNCVLRQRPAADESRWALAP